jgi:hypothetical protein
MSYPFFWMRLLRKIAFCLTVLGLLVRLHSELQAAPGTSGLSGSFSNVAAGAVINLTSEGEIDWVHWGLYTETSIDRKSGVVPQISDFTLLDAPAGFAFAYWFGDNASGYTWTDGTPTAGVTNTTTGVWAYGTPLIGSGFEVIAPADTVTRTLRVHVGTYGARGQFAAYLSDGSSPGYTNSSLMNMANGPGGFYTVTYRANSAGQQLITRWTLQTPMRPDGNVTLQAASMTASNFNNPPAVFLTAPVNNSTLPAGSTLTMTASANDSDGSVAKVEFFADGVKLDEDASSPFSIDWSNVPSGNHVLTAVATDAQGASSQSAPIEIFVNGTGGSLLGNLAVPTALPASVNLTIEGSRDWVHWGLATNNLLNRKAGVTAQVGDFAKIGSSPVEIYGDNYTAFNWSDGTPTAATNNITRGVFTTGVANGFEIVLPADTTARTARIYVGLYGAQGNFQAWLSDYSASAYANTTLSNFFGNDYGVYTLTYLAASPGQTLHVRYRSLRLFDQDFGNVTLQAVTLVANSGGNIPPTVGIINPANGTVLTAPASFTVSATAGDTDGTVANVEFFNGITSLGIDASDPYSAAVNNLTAGTYSLTAVATDNLGAKATNSVSITVNALPTAILLTPTNGQVFIAPANITLTASASDSDGSVTNVEFYNATTRLGSDATSPYTFAWNNVAAGNYTLTVKATDNHGAVVTSTPVNISVGSTPPEAVTLVNPVWNGSAFMFSFASQVGRDYEVQAMDVLGTAAWQRLTNLVGNGATMTVTNGNSGATQRTFRIESK